MKLRTLGRCILRTSIIRADFLPHHPPAANTSGGFVFVSYNVFFFSSKRSRFSLSSKMPRNNKKVKNAPPTRPRGPGKPAGPSSNPTKGQQHGNGYKQGSGNANAPKKASMQVNQRPIVPFLRKDRVLLIGEGELFFVLADMIALYFSLLCKNCSASMFYVYLFYECPYSELLFRFDTQD